MTEKLSSLQPEPAELSFREQAKRHGERLAEQGYSSLPAMNLDCIDFHCDAFGVPTSMRQGHAMLGFREMVRSIEAGLMETSVKVVDGTLHAARFNLLCSPSDPAAVVGTAIAYFEWLAHAEEIPLPIEPLRLFVDGLQWSAVTRIFCGIDLREDRKKSRVKLWFMADDEPGVASNPVQRALARAGANSAMDALHVHPSLLIGFDLRFDGELALKLYPDVWEAELQDTKIRERLASVLTPRSLEVMEDAYWTHFYMTCRDTDVMIDLHLKDPDDFVRRRLLHPLAQTVHSVYAGVPSLNVIAAIPQSDLDCEVVQNFSLYYMPAASPRGAR